MIIIMVYNSMLMVTTNGVAHNEHSKDVNLLSERFCLTCKLWLMAAILICSLGMTSCSKDDDDIVIVPTPEEQVVLNCAKPEYLKAGDKVAMISPSYFTPMETIEKAADVLRSWGFEPVMGPNVGKVLDGKIGGTVEERVSGH